MKEQSTALATAPQESTSLSLIREAMANGADANYLRELLAVKRDWEADEARKAYFQAISEFQRRAPIIAKLDDAHGKKYAKMDRIWREVRPLFTELGLSCTWQACTVADGLCHVEGQLAHISGHSVPLVMDVALPALITGQNAAQQIGSARTYATRYAFCAAVGLQTGEDDDGNAAGTRKLTEEQAKEVTKRLKECEALDKGVTARVLEWLGVEHVNDIPVESYHLALNELSRKLKAASK